MKEHTTRTVAQDPHSMGESADASHVNGAPEQSFLEKRDAMVESMMSQHQACKNQK